MVENSLRGLLFTDSKYDVIFVLFKHKKDKDYELFTNTVFDKENEAEEFGKKKYEKKL